MSGPAIINVEEDGGGGHQERIITPVRPDGRQTGVQKSRAKLYRNHNLPLVEKTTKFGKHAVEIRIQVTKQLLQQIRYPWVKQCKKIKSRAMHLKSKNKSESQSLI